VVDPESKEMWEEFNSLITPPSPSYLKRGPEENTFLLQNYCCQLIRRIITDGIHTFRVDRDDKMISMLPLNFCPCCGKKVK
jgi:hypothetical protein